MVVEPVVDEFGDPSHQTEGEPVDATAFLEFVDASESIPIASNPHAVFVFSSLQNFVAGVYDTINANWVLAGNSAVSHL